MRRREKPTGQLVKSLLILVALTGLSVVSTAQGQNAATLIGLSKDLSRHMNGPDGEYGFIRVETPHCRPFGLGASEDLPPPNQYRFVDFIHAQNANVDTRGVTFTMRSIPLPWCKPGEGMY